MAIKKTQRGFALLVAVIFMTVMLTFGLSLGALSYKQAVLASGAQESQYAFYAADAGLECALYADQQSGAFIYPLSDPGVAPSMSCDGIPALSASEVWNTAYWVVTERLSLDSGTTHPRCADVTIYKYKDAQANGTTSYLYSQGYDVSCGEVASSNNPRIVSRGINVHY